MKKPDASITIPQRGERLLLIGQTGSGKSVLASQLIERAPAPVFVLDSKGEPAVQSIEERVHSMGQLRGMRREEAPDYVLIQPSVEEVADPASLDEYVRIIHEWHTPATLYIDELYMMHNGGRAYPGLIGAYTRGRSAGLTLIGGTQRPAWVSRFALSESSAYIVFRIVDRTDKKRISEVIPGFDKLEQPQPFHWCYFRHGDMEPSFYPPVPFRHPDFSLPRPFEPTEPEVIEKYWI